MDSLDVIIVHEFNGQKYFEAVSKLQESGEINSLRFVESSVFKQLIRNLFRDRLSLVSSIKRAVRNAFFRLQVPSIKEKVIILGIPPWDFRMLWYGMLAKNNYFIYHTSWPNWNLDTVPRQYGPFNPFLRRRWHHVLQSNAVQIVGVASEAAKRVDQHFSEAEVTVIPHVVSAEFSKVAPTRLGRSFGILFVGELIEKKGIGLLTELIKRLADLPTVHFGIVGTGPLTPLVKTLEKSPNVTVYGKVGSREKLAEIYAQHHVLVVPSQKTKRWEELFGMVIVEAMSVGLPVVASNHIGPRSIITSQEDGFLVSENSIDEFVQAIQSLNENSDTWKTLSHNAQTKAGSYSLEAVSAQWLTLLSSRQKLTEVDSASQAYSQSTL